MNTRQRQRLDELRQLHDQRKDLVARAKHPPSYHPALLELVVARRMSTAEAGEMLGLSGEGVAYRLRPMKKELGLNVTGWTNLQRVLSSIDRPYKNVTDGGLRILVKRESKEYVDSRRRAAAEARKLKSRMSNIISSLTATSPEGAKGLRPKEIAEYLGVNEMAISRLRQGTKK